MIMRHAGIAPSRCSRASSVTSSSTSPIARRSSGGVARRCRSWSSLHGAFVEAPRRRVTPHGRSRSGPATWRRRRPPPAPTPMPSSTSRRSGVAQMGNGTDVNAPNKMAASLASELRIRIAEGKLQDGDQLPPMPELAAEFGVSRPTIARVPPGARDGTAGRPARRFAPAARPCRVPTTETAAQLSGIVLAAARTSIADVAEAQPSDRARGDRAPRDHHRSATRRRPVGAARCRRRRRPTTPRCSSTRSSTSSATHSPRSTTPRSRCRWR